MRGLVLDEREAVRPGCGRRAGRVGHVPGRRRELRVEQERRDGTAGSDDLRGRLRRLVDVRTAEVEFDRHVLEDRARLRVVARGETADGDPDGFIERAQTRKHVADECVAARVREPDRVEHSRVGLGDTNGRVSFARLRRDRDRKSTRLNSSHVKISYAVFCLKKKKKTRHNLKLLTTNTKTLRTL